MTLSTILSLLITVLVWRSIRYIGRYCEVLEWTYRV